MEQTVNTAVITSLHLLSIYTLYRTKHRACTMCMLSRVQLFVTPWTIRPPGPSVHGVFQARVLEWVAISSSGDLPDSRIRLASLVSPVLAGRFLTTTPSGKFCFPIRCHCFPTNLWIDIVMTV